MSTENENPKAPEEIKTAPAPPAAQKKKNPKLIIGLVVLVLILLFVIRTVINSMSIVSTDDAYVNSHVTFVAPRVAGQVAEVLVDDNNRVHKGSVLVRLDDEPYRVEVNIKQAAVNNAIADLAAANANVRGIIGQVRGARFKLDHTIDEVHNQIELVKANVAALQSAKATLTLAQAEFERAKKLLETKVTSNEEYDQKLEANSRAQAQYNLALQNVYQSRVALGLPSKVGEGDDPAVLTQIPDDLDQTSPAVREALSELIQIAAQLKVVPSSYKLTPSQVIKEFLDRDKSGDIDVIYDKLIKDTPLIKQAEAKLMAAQRDLDQANLNLKYCTIVSEIDGVVTRRNVNPGNNVQVGQSLMAVRSLTDVWVDANFKETQISKLRIGQPVDLETDVYGGRKIFKGRISGFTMGTGSTLALLPAENATGNFVKVVQRLPVRIDLIDYDPDKDVLFVGTSVTPKVHIREDMGGDNAGKLLQPYLALPTPPPALPGATPAPVQTGTTDL